jgi:hypothetical protein
MKRSTRMIASAGLALSAACSNAGTATVAEQTEPLTYWQDMLPLFEQHCLSCHRDGGIAPFRLDDYAAVKPQAAAIRAATAQRSMPPWGVTSDGSCGQFAGSLALTDQEIARIGAWVDAGAQEGDKAPVSVPAAVTLSAATELSTPNFLPEIAGGELAEEDEYRCFELELPRTESSFITGYEVVPGRPEIIHHVLLMLVDPDAAAEGDGQAGRTNLEQLRALDADSPDRDGWPCFGAAGDGVAVEAFPVVWAPGQGVVRYPNQSGVPLSTRHKLIAQVHYNLADPNNRGKSDQTQIRLQIAATVQNIGNFVLEDPLLSSLRAEPPVTLPAGQTSTTYTWHETMADLGIGARTGVQLYGVMPHMHQLGHKYQMHIGTPDGSDQCEADVQHWDFHWQRMYFYADPLPVDADTTISVSCDYDTSQLTQPVRPGWGTRNEMCLAALYFTTPAHGD